MIHTCAVPTPDTGQSFIIVPSLQIYCLASHCLRKRQLGKTNVRCEFRNHTTWSSWELAAHFSSTDPKIACVTDTCLEAESTALSWSF